MIFKLALYRDRKSFRTFSHVIENLIFICIDFFFSRTSSFCEYDDIIISRPATSAVDVYFHNVISLRQPRGGLLFFFGMNGRQEGGSRFSSGCERWKNRGKEKVRGGCFAGNWCQFNPARRSRRINAKGGTSSSEKRRVTVSPAPFPRRGEAFPSSSSTKTRVHTHAATPGLEHAARLFLCENPGERNPSRYVRTNAHACRARERTHQENIINGNRSRIWLGLTLMGNGGGTGREGDEAPRQILRGYRIE